MSNPTNLLFLGAGASYGSERDKSLVPPLGNNLFDALVEFEPKLWKQIPDDVACVYRNDFEKGMLELNTKMPHALPVVQRSMAAFFFRYAPMASSLYLRFAKRIQSSSWKG